MKNLIINTIVLALTLTTTQSFATDANTAMAERINQQLKRPPVVINTMQLKTPVENRLK